MTTCHVYLISGDVLTFSRNTEGPRVKGRLWLGVNTTASIEDSEEYTTVPRYKYTSSILEIVHCIGRY